LFSKGYRKTLRQRFSSHRTQTAVWPHNLKAGARTPAPDKEDTGVRGNMPPTQMVQRGPKQET